jgi:hypothetical protein
VRDHPSSGNPPASEWTPPTQWPDPLARNPAVTMVPTNAITEPSRMASRNAGGSAGSRPRPTRTPVVSAVAMSSVAPTPARL